MLLILEDQTRNYGGYYCVRNLKLLESVIYMTESGFEGNYLHKTIPALEYIGYSGSCEKTVQTPDFGIYY